MNNFRFTAQNKIRLDEFLRIELPKALKKEISNSKIRRLILSGNVYVKSNQIRNPAFILFPSSNIDVSVDEGKLFFEKTPDDIKYDVSEKDVLYEDEFIILVNKPPFFPTEAGMVGSRDNLHAAIVRYLHGKKPELRNPPYAGIMHRLDRETSGVILFTKSREANKNSHDMFESHTARKTYIALVSQKGNGKVKENFSVEMKMVRISGKTQAAKWGEDQRNGQDSRTDFKILKRFEKNEKTYFLVECKPLTGRTHQIRVHLSSVNLPIVGDELYGGENANRIHLHANSLEFPHPISNEKMKIEANIIEDNFSFKFPLSTFNL